MQYRMFSGIPGLHPLDASSTPLWSCQSKMSWDISICPSGKGGVPLYTAKPQASNQGEPTAHNRSYLNCQPIYMPVHICLHFHLPDFLISWSITCLWNLFLIPVLSWFSGILNSSSNNSWIHMLSPRYIAFLLFSNGNRNHTRTESTIF